VPSFSRAPFITAVILAVANSASGQADSNLNCKLRAAPPPMATFGGPAVAGSGRTELGVGAGAFGEWHYFDCAPDIAGGSNWFARWRRGLGGRADLGFDGLVSTEADGTQTGVAKVAARFQATQGLRLEAGAGAADSGDGRAVNGDLAAVIGTIRRPGETWNYYASIRLAASHGCFNLFCAGGVGPPGSRAPGAIIPMGAIGATARITDTGRFVMEAGLGDITSRQQPNPGLYIHFAVGLQFVVGKGSQSAGTAPERR
jgi:hypothetical protein